MAGLNCDTCFGTLIIAGINMHCPAWCVDSAALTQLMRYRLVGEDKPTNAETEGARPYQRTIEVTEHSLPIFIAGETDRLGNLYTNPWNGLYRNLDYLFDNLVDPPGSVAGTRLAVFNPPDEPSRTGPLHVLDIRYGQPITDDTQGPALVGTLELSIPGGRLT